MQAEDFLPLFDASLMHGLNLWDTATAYFGGESEKAFGALIQSVGRKKGIVPTKFTP